MCQSQKNLHYSTNKNEERSLKLDLFKYSSDYSHFSAMNVKHLITNWQDFLHKNSWHSSSWATSVTDTLGYMEQKKG